MIGGLARPAASQQAAATTAAATRSVQRRRRRPCARAQSGPAQTAATTATTPGAGWRSKPPGQRWRLSEEKKYMWTRRAPSRPRPDRHGVGEGPQARRWPARWLGRGQDARGQRGGWRAGRVAIGPVEALVILTVSPVHCLHFLTNCAHTGALCPGMELTLNAPIVCVCPNDRAAAPAHHIRSSRYTFHRVGP